VQFSSVTARKDAGSLDPPGKGELPKGQTPACLFPGCNRE